MSKLQKQTTLVPDLQTLTGEIQSIGANLTTQKTQVIKTAVYLGALLNELKEAVGHGPFIKLRRELLPAPAFSDDTCERYMKAAQNIVNMSGIVIDIGVRKLLSAPDEDLSNENLEARQSLFDFMENTTIKECISGVVVDGDEAHRITRAANGKKLGGTKGEDRKDFPKFIGEKLSDVSAHLKTFKTYTPAQVADTLAKFDSAVGKWPTPLLTHLKQRIHEELKTR